MASVAVRWLRRADLGTEEIACRTAQNLYSLHRSRRFHETGTRDPRHLNGASDISTVMPGYPSMGVNRIFGILEHGGDKGFWNRPAASHSVGDRRAQPSQRFRITHEALAAFLRL